MRALVGVLGLLIVLALVGLLVRKQLAPAAHGSAGVSPQAAASMPASAPGSNPRQQSDHIQGQVRQSLESVLQQERPQENEK